MPHRGFRHAEALLATAIIGHDQTMLSQPCVSRRTFEVDTSSVGLIDFDMSEEAKLEAFEDGRSAAEKFLAVWNWNQYLAECR